MSMDYMNKTSCQCCGQTGPELGYLADNTCDDCGALTCDECYNNRTKLCDQCTSKIYTNHGIHAPLVEVPA